MFCYLYKNQFVRFIVFVFLSIISSLFEVGLAYVMLKCVDFAMVGNMSKAWRYAGWLSFYIIVFFIVDYFSKKLKWKILEFSQMKLRNDVVDKIFSMSYREFHRKNTSSWLSILINQLNVIEESYFKIWFNVFIEMFQFIVSLIFLLYISPYLVLFVLIITMIQMIIPKLMSPLIAKKKKEQVIEAEQFAITATEHLGGFDLLKSFQLTAKSLQAIHLANERWEERKYNVRIFTTLARLLSYTFGQILYVGIYFFGALLTILGYMSVGTMIAASQLVVYIASPLQTLSDDITEIRSAREIIKNLEKEIQSAKEEKKKIKTVPSNFQKIELRQVSFSYEEHQIFENVDLTLQSGKKYLLCAPSGTGKSTFIQLLTKILKPDQGYILIDGEDIEHFLEEEYARFILCCTQNTFIFNASLRDNITLFNDKFAEKEILEVLNRVGLQYILEHFDDGLDHMIAQGGYTLSGGERQKIALARMELYDPPVIIFDESFANIDLKTTKRLIDNITSKSEKTIIVVAHQISEEIISCFDEKIVLKNKHILLEV